MYSDAIYSFYEHAKGRILTKNPNRIVAGLLNAQDWPSKPIKMEAFYLLVIADTPIGSQGYSQYAPMLFHNVQWVWIIKGTDTVQGVRAANRGDRFTKMQDMKGELLYGLAPGYTQKLSWSLDGSGKFVGVQKDPSESITWNPVDFKERLDKASGLEYGVGALRVFSMTEAIAS